MKIKTIIYSIAMVLSSTLVNAQANTPAGYVNGSITLADGSVITGFIKDNMKKSASVSFIDSGNKTKNYKGIDINGASLNGSSYVCIKGDFFRSISTGK